MYSITLNFFIPGEIVRKLNKIKISPHKGFECRKPGLCHCTIKAIALIKKIPDRATINKWIESSDKILKNQRSFFVDVGNIGEFPDAIFAKVKSDDLVSLHKKLYNLLPSSQPQYENENYKPHISLITRKVNSKSKLSKTQGFGKFKVKEIQLVSWDEKDLDRPVIVHKFSLKD